MSEEKPQRPHPDAFNMAVFMNLVSLQADTLHANHRRNMKEPIDHETAVAMAERAYKIVARWFEYTDPSGLWSKALATPAPNLIDVVAQTLVDELEPSDSDQDAADRAH